tara:strand:+ start:102 stop:1223 length:1122 start_codon:yes stop_codon:yes gene_type:complete
MNKTITISSIGQNPENFTVNLPETLKIPKNHEIALISMSVDARNNTGFHYENPQSYYNLSSQTASTGTGSYDLNGIVFFFNNNTAQTINILTYNGIHGHDYEITLWNTNIRWIKMTSQTTFNYYTVESGNFVLTGVIDTSTTPNRLTFSSGTNWDVYSPSSGIIPFSSALNVTFSNYTGSNNHTFLASVSDGTSFYLTRTSFKHYNYHTTDGATFTLTAIIDDSNTPHTLTLSNGIIYTASSNWTLIQPNFSNGSIPRAEWFITLDNLPISNYLTNQTTQSILPIVYTNHGRYDNENDESIRPVKVIYHSLTNQNTIFINQIQVSIRDNIDGSILHSSTLLNSTNLTLHIRQNEHFKHQDLQYFILNKIAHKK